MRPDCILDGEIVALDNNGALDFAALKAALSEGKTKELVFFAFDLLFEGKTNLRRLPLSRRKETARSPSCRATTRMLRLTDLSSISKRAAIPCCGQPAGFH